MVNHALFVILQMLHSLRALPEQLPLHATKDIISTTEAVLPAHLLTLLGPLALPLSILLAAYLPII